MFSHPALPSLSELRHLTPECLFPTVDAESVTPALRDALARLLDDPSPTVRRAVLAHFKALGQTGQRVLHEISAGPNRLAATHARWFLTELSFADPVNEFRGFIRSLNYELETGILLMCRTVYPDLDVAAFCEALDRIAARCRELIAEPSSPREKVRSINRVLFHELGFRGNERYTDPENSFLNRVLETRRGIPISLSVLYLLVAERCALQLEPIGLPGHFVVGCFLEDQPFFIDAFSAGRLLEVDDVADLLRRQNLAPEPAHYAPDTVREVLTRACRNLESHFAQADNPRLARLFASFVEEFEDTHARNSAP